MKIKNIKTGVIKDIKSEVEVSMYLATREWEELKETPKKTVEKTNNTFKKGI